jgi:pseudouridine synthase
MVEGIRLNRYLSLCGIGSRRTCEEYIRQGRISINNQKVTNLATLVSTVDKVCLDDILIGPERLTYIVMNKPRGFLTSLSESENRRNVGQLLNGLPFVKPAGRLDMNTTGVLLFTNDGQLLYRLTHPKYEIPRVYEVFLDKELNLNLKKVLDSGLKLNHKKIVYGKVLRQQGKYVKLQLSEGLYHEVKRIFGVLGYKVVEMNRVSYAGIKYGNLKRGEWRYLSSSEVDRLKKICNLV